MYSYKDDPKIPLKSISESGNSSRNLLILHPKMKELVGPIFPALNSLFDTKLSFENRTINLNFAYDNFPRMYKEIIEKNFKTVFLQAPSPIDIGIIGLEEIFKNKDFASNNPDFIMDSPLDDFEIIRTFKKECMPIKPKYTEGIFNYILHSVKKNNRSVANSKDPFFERLKILHKIMSISWSFCHFLGFKSEFDQVIVTQARENNVLNEKRYDALDGNISKSYTETIGGKAVKVTDDLLKLPTIFRSKDSVGATAVVKSASVDLSPNVRVCTQKEIGIHAGTFSKNHITSNIIYHYGRAYAREEARNLGLACLACGHFECLYHNNCTKACPVCLRQPHSDKPRHRQRNDYDDG